MKKGDSFLFVESKIIYNFMGSAGQCKVVKQNKKVPNAQTKDHWYFVTIIVLTYCEKKLFQCEEKD